MAQELTHKDIVRPEGTPIVKRVLNETDGYVEDHQDRERTLIQRMFPDQQQRHIDVARRKAIRAHYEHQNQVLHIAYEARLQEIKEIYNDFLVKGKTKIRKEQAEFFQHQFETLMTNISTKSQEFGERVNTACDQLAKLKVDFLKQKQEQLIQDIVDNYYETVDKLIQNFRKILDEEIHRPGLSKNVHGMEE